jgi:hypothetical protein
MSMPSTYDATPQRHAEVDSIHPFFAQYLQNPFNPIRSDGIKHLLHPLVSPWSARGGSGEGWLFVAPCQADQSIKKHKKIAVGEAGDTATSFN